MNQTTRRATLLLASVLLAAPMAALAADKAKDKPSAKPKPYPLKVCLVQGDKLDKDAFVFVHQGQEIKLCCDGCKEDFDKDPAKYLKKLQKPAKK